LEEEEKNLIKENKESHIKYKIRGMGMVWKGLGYPIILL
jgi:hypothetical protein